MRTFRAKRYTHSAHAPVHTAPVCHRDSRESRAPADTLTPALGSITCITESFFAHRKAFSSSALRVNAIPMRRSHDPRACARGHGRGRARRTAGRRTVYLSLARVSIPRRVAYSTVCVPVQICAMAGAPPLAARPPRFFGPLLACNLVCSQGVYRLVDGLYLELHAMPAPASLMKQRRPFSVARRTSATSAPPEPLRSQFS